MKLEELLKNLLTDWVKTVYARLDVGLNGKDIRGNIITCARGKSLRSKIGEYYKKLTSSILCVGIICAILGAVAAFGMSWTKERWQAHPGEPKLVFQFKKVVDELLRYPNDITVNEIFQRDYASVVGVHQNSSIKIKRPDGQGAFALEVNGKVSPDLIRSFFNTSYLYLALHYDKKTISDSDDIPQEFFNAVLQFRFINKLPDGADDWKCVILDIGQYLKNNRQKVKRSQGGYGYFLDVTDYVVKNLGSAISADKHQLLVSNGNVPIECYRR